MDLRRLTLTYLVGYLAVAAVGFAFFPQQFMDLFQSDGDYGVVMPRLVGLMMGALALLIFNILRNEDWQYYVVSIYVRTVIVAFLFYLWAISDDPMFLLINVVVLIGLVPSYYVHFIGGEKRGR